METHKEKPVESKSGSSIQTAPSWTWRILILIFIILCLSGWMVSCNWEKTDDSTTNSNTPEVSYKEVLELKFDGYTPCNPNIDYKFELDTQGDPIYLKFPGVNTLVYYSGKGTIKVPPRNFGPVEITSLNPKKQVRVRIWKVINIKN
jgi:hypothetical protein